MGWLGGQDGGGERQGDCNRLHSRNKNRKKVGGESKEKVDDVQEEEQQVKTVTLSRLLDNVVILEESIKELVAIIHARRSLGIDSIRYL